MPYDADEFDVDMELRKVLINAAITLGRGIAVIVDALLKVSMLKPARENSIPQQPRPRVRNHNFQIFNGISRQEPRTLAISRQNSVFVYTVLIVLRQLPTASLESLPDYGVEDSSTGEYFTADDGYEADIEVLGGDSGNNIPKRSNSFGPVVEPRDHANVHPALCSLAIDLLIHFSEQ